MANINDFNPKLLSVNEFTVFENGSIMFDINYCQLKKYTICCFNNIECSFRKSGVFSY